MKKILFFAALVLGLASCSTDPEDLNVVVGGEQDVMLNVSLPEATRSASNAGFDFTNFESNNDYDLRYILEIRYNGKVSRTVKTAESTSVSFPVRLAPGREYDFTVWADLVLEGTEDDLCYNTNVDGAGLTNITIKNEKWTANNELRDAYYGKATLTEEQSITNLGTIELTRPFAKIRVISTDIADVRKFDIEPYSVSVQYLKEVYTSFNAVTGVAGTPVANKTVSAEYANAKYDDFDTAEATLFADYIFVPNDGTIQFSMDVKTESKSIKATSFTTPIAVGKNKLTTIKGDVLTEGGDVNVDIEDEFGGESGIEDGKTFAKVDTVEEFLDAINKGIEKITLEGDIDLNTLLTAGTLSTRAGATLPFVIAEGKTLELDLNGYKITTPWENQSAEKHYYAFENHGSLTIQDSSEGKTGEIIARGIFNYGTMTLESGKINACDHNGGYGVRNYEGATFVMNGGSISTSNEDGDLPGAGYDATTLRIDEGATAEINAGTINNICNYTFAIDNHGATTVNGGTMTSIHSTVSSYGNMTINGGSFTCNGLDGVSAHALVTWDGSVTNIYGGTFDGKDNYNGFNVDACAGALVNIYGGKFLPVHSGSLYGEGTIIVTGGEFFDNPSARVAPGYKAEQENDVYVVRKPQALIDFENAVANGEDVTLSEDLTLIDPVAVPEGKEVTINLNGKTLDIYTHKSVGGVLKNDGTLAIEGGVISSKANNGGSAIANNGTLTVKNATLNGAPNADGSWPAYTVNNTGTMTLENSTITSKHGSVASYGEGAVLTLNNCTIDMAGIAGFTSHGIYTYNGGKVIINGGTYKNNATDQNSTGASVINGNVEVNAGTFTGRIENYYGTPVLKGGTYSVKPNNAFVAEGYKVIEKDGKYVVVSEEVDNIVASKDDVQNALTDAVAAGETDIVIDANGAEIGDLNYGLTASKIPAGTTVTIKNATVAGRSYGNGVNGTVIFDGCTFNNSGAYSIHFDNGTGEVIFRNCHLYGWNSFGSTLTSVTFENCTLEGNGTYALIRSYVDLTLTNCTIDVSNANHGDVYDEGVEAVNDASLTMTNTKYEASNNNGLNYALVAGANKVTLLAGNYELSGLNFVANDVTLKGVDKANVVLNLENSIYLQNKSVTLENLTYNLNAGKGYTEQAFAFVHHATAFNLKNCNVNRLRLNVCEANIEDCTFTLNTSSGFDGYCIYYYGNDNSTVNVKNSTFATAGKGICIYSESAKAYNLNVDKCSFTSSDSATDKAAIQMHTELGIYGNVKITETTATGFADINGGLWNELNNNTKVATDKFDIWVDGTQVH